jgi:ribosome-associated heat shock protein Hsp15
MNPETSSPLPEVRLDKWLWAVRLFKTRGQAADACRLQRVKFAGQEVKASRTVRIGEIYEVELEEITRTVQVKGVLERRVAGKLVENYAADLTPEEILQAARERRESLRLSPPIAPEFRPSKKAREMLRQLYQQSEE